MALQFPEDLSRWPGYIRFTPVDKDNVPLNEQVELPIPSGLQFADGMTYDNADLGTLGLVLEKAVGGEGLEAVMNRYTNELSGEDGGKGVGFQKLASDIGVKAGGNQVRNLQNRTPNPNTTLLFKQPNLRTFQFQFKLIPSVTGEVDTIEKIIQNFRTHMYPQFDATEDGDDLFYEFPHKFQIRMWLGNGKTITEKPITPKIDYCYLTSMNTVFNSSTNAVMSRRGSNLSFAETDISLTFMEAKALNSAKIRLGY
jgi:hypothetical protein